MSRMARQAALWLVTISCLGSVLACGGGGGGGSGSSGGEDPSDANTFFLKSASLARAILDFDDQLASLVSPASLYETDPLTGVALPGFPKVLNPGGKLNQIASLNLAQITDPLTPQVPVVPRNAAIVLEFTKAIDAATLGLTPAADEAAPNMITSNSPVQIRRKDGALVPTRAWVDDKRLVLLGITPETLGWEASPLVFDSQGNVAQDPTGFMRIILGVIGTVPLRAIDGTVLGNRPDGLGGVNKPFPFNPGNSQLDAIVQQTDTGTVTFNGFLPDKSPPRIIRGVTASGSISSISTTTSGGQVVIRIEDADLFPLPNVLANGGLGEWASALMTVTSAGGVTSEYIVDDNSIVGGVAVFDLVPGSVLAPPVAVDDTYVITRTEFYEPIPPPLPTSPQELARLTVDPVNVPRDPLDPQDLLNSDLRYFLRVFDEDGVERLDRWNPSTGTFLPIPPKSALQVRFNEPMDVASFRPYESFYVKPSELDATDPAFEEMRIGNVQGLDAGRIIRFRPFLEDQVDPQASEFVGFGGTGSSLRLVLRTLPEGSDIAALLASASPTVLDQLQDIQTLGVLGINDLGGRGLGLPAALLDQGDTENFLLVDGSVARGPFAPAVDFSVEFQTQNSDDPDYGVIVHRFMGQPKTATFAPPVGVVYDEVTAGVEFNDYPPLDVNDDGNFDRRFIYGPQLAEVGLNVPGFLTGAPANTIEHVVDNFNAPKPSQFASPNGEDFLIATAFGTGTPINSPFGARFQHVFRSGDASPAANDFLGVVLDLVGLAWAPLPELANTDLDGMEILVGLSGVNRGRGPNTNQNNGIPDDQNSGLKQQFDCNRLEYTANCCEQAPTPALAPFLAQQPPLTTVVKRGTPYPIRRSNLFKPVSAGATGAFNEYLDYPKFNAGIDPQFGSDDVFSFPYDSRYAMLIEYRVEPNADAPATNLYRFSPGIQTSVLPRFRIWSQGQHPLAHCVMNTQSNLLAGGEGGPLIEPGSTTTTVLPPEPNNGMPPQPPTEYILPPREMCVSVQPIPDWMPGALQGDDQEPNFGCVVQFPTCNTNPDMNYYFANGMLAYPLPNLAAYPGPTGQPPTFYYGYGHPAGAASGDPSRDGDPCLIPFGTGQSNLPDVTDNEPSMTNPPARWGDNSRYYMMWKYKKRVSIVQSPTLEVDSPSGFVRYLRPVIEPPLDTIDPLASIKVEIKAGPLLDFSVPAIDSGYVDVESPTFEEDVTGISADRVFVKFRASFGVAPASTQPPVIDTIIIPYERLDP